ncbi:MAG: hypothetical protein JXA68_07890 [Ignavibacteriales bacterium]|nr:hypothetical protein [Ignavibacteriales bacterium]
MKTRLFFIANFIFTIIVSGQQTKSLSEQMWNRVVLCHSTLKENFEEADEYGILYDVIDDSKNGYLMVGGAFPPCGCECYHYVGAYKGDDGRYTFIEKEKWSCSWTHKISSDKNLSEIFPVDFNIKSFIPSLDNYENIDFALFYLDVEIPRKGTDTEVMIKVIPFGMFYESDNILTFEFKEENNTSNCRSIYQIYDLVNKIQDEYTLELILKNEFEKISEAEMEVIKGTIGSGYGGFESLDELRMYLIKIKNVYDLYSRIEYEKIIFGWDRKLARFYIKRKGQHSKNMTFKEFLLENQYWSPVC